MFKNLKNVLNNKLKLRCIIALIQSIITYGIAFWGSAYQ